MFILGTSGCWWRYNISSFGWSSHTPKPSSSNGSRCGRPSHCKGHSSKPLLCHIYVKPSNFWIYIHGWCKWHFALYTEGYLIV